MKNHTALLIGGTGAMGRYIASDLLSNDWHVHITSRKNNKSNNTNMTFIKGDGTNIKFLKNVLTERNYDVVIDFMIHDLDCFKDVIRLMKRKVAHYIFISSYRVFSNSNGKRIDENSQKIIDTKIPNEYRKSKEYALEKCRQERILEESNFNNWTIARPSITYSTNRLQFLCYEAGIIMPRSLLSLPLPYCNEIENIKTTYTWAGDVSKMLLAIINKKQFAIQESFNVVTSDFSSWKEISKIYEKYLNTKFLSVSKDSLEKTTTNIWQLKYDRYIDRVCDNSKILKLSSLDQESLMPVYQGLPLEIKNTIKKNNNYYSCNFENGCIDRIFKTYHMGNYKNLKNIFGYYRGYFL